MGTSFVYLSRREFNNVLILKFIAFLKPSYKCQHFHRVKYLKRSNFELKYLPSLDLMDDNMLLLCSYHNIRQGYWLQLTTLTSCTTCSAVQINLYTEGVRNVWQLLDLTPRQSDTQLHSFYQLVLQKCHTLVLSNFPDTKSCSSTNVNKFRFISD